MINRKFLGTLALALVLFFCFFATGSVNAQSVGIKISPVVFDEPPVEPGQVIKKQIKITNESNAPRVFYAYLRDFGAEGETGQARLLAPGTDYGYSIASWISVASEGVEFASNEERVIDFTINIPMDVSPGSYRGAILFGTEPPRVQVESEDKGAGMSVAQQAASLVLIRVKGDVMEEASIQEFNTDKDFYSTPYKTDFLVRVKNSGTVHIKPHGTIEIKNMFGKEVAVIRVNEAGGNILPGSIRRFMDVKWEGKNGFGKYTATLGLTYGTETSAGGQGKSSMVGTKSFWIIPWRLIVPVGLALLILSLSMFFMLRLYRNRAVKQAMERAGVSNLRKMKNQKNSSPVLHLTMIIVASFIAMLLIFVIIYIFFIA